MKNWISITAAAVMLASMGTLTAGAEDTAQVKVTISDTNGAVAVCQQEITVTDVDSDGALTINDALVIAHDKFYDGGSAAGYASSVGTYGLAVDKLWGTENGGAFGFRDQLQDAVNLILLDPSPARRQILRCCAHQYAEGDVQHWWQPCWNLLPCGLRCWRLQKRGVY